jgi:hypothetical protein
LENYPENLLKNYRFFSFAGCKDKGGQKHQPNCFKGYFSPISITQYSIAFAVKKNLESVDKLTLRIVDFAQKKAFGGC